jgi:hypothetical protein
MGVLDDAIRDHLELKRRRGADPSEVALLERRALGQREQDEDAGERSEWLEASEAAVEMDSEAPRAPDAGAGVADTPLAGDAGGRAAPGETIEIDMRSLIGEDSDAGHGSQHEGTGSTSGSDGTGGEAAAPAAKDRRRRSVGRFRSTSR